MLWTWPTRRNWSVWDEMDRLQREMNRLFEPGQRERGTPAGEFPAVNVWVGDDTALLTAEIPGVAPKEIEVTVKDDVVTIRGSRQADALQDDQDYIRHERGAGNFARSFALPFHVDPDTVVAEYRMGILQLTLPRAEEDKPKKIAVKAG